jgi:hypothetical protein
MPKITICTVMAIVLVLLPGTAIRADEPVSILFVGNSYTAAQGGLHVHLRNLALSADPLADVFTRSVTRGGYTLQAHWHDQQTRRAIYGHPWDLVVLQEQSQRPVLDPGLMRQYARLLDSSIRISGADTGFFMTWAREYDPGMIEDLAKAYDRVGGELGALVVPVGRAWQLSLDQWPELTLHTADGSHPNAHGTYLTVCTFYAAIWERSPVGIEYAGSPEISETEKLFLQQVAWDTVQQYR